MDFYRTAKGGPKKYKKKHKKTKKTCSPPLGTPGDLGSSCQVLCSFCLSILGLRGPLGDFWGLLGSSCRVLCVFLSINFGPQGTTGGLLGSPGLQLSHIMRSFRFSSSGLRGPLGDSWRLLGYSCRVLCVLFCLSISDLGGPLGDAWGFLCSSCRVLRVLFVCQFRASGDLIPISE